MTGAAQLAPYTSWVDFAAHLKHEESVINFIAAYGTHPSIASAATTADVAPQRWPSSLERDSPAPRRSGWRS